MYQIQLINVVRYWERRLEIEAEKQKKMRNYSNSDSVIADSSGIKERISEVFKRTEPKSDPTPLYCCHTHENS